jgi:Carbohydrate esterase, sialic acid-specific acetylesterase
VAGSTIASDVAAAQPQPVHVFVLAGQSNMVGRGFPLTLASPTDPRLLLWRDGSWQTASDPLGPPDNPSSGIGPGMTFGLQLLKRLPTWRIGLVMCAKGATSIQDWQPDKKLYRSCVEQVRAAAGGQPPAGILFLQGERGGSVAQAAGWTEGFRPLYRAFRNDFGEKVPFLLGQIGTFVGLEDAQASIREQQARLAAELPFTRLVRSLDLPTEGNHYTVPAYRVLGARFATAWYRLWRDTTTQPR